MPVPRRRHCSARRDRGRTHKGMETVQGMADCKSCGKPRMPHRVCPNCGEFKGRQYGPLPSSSESK
ncbi:MAG: 50S ribosomal protein L32 [Candidatus Sumerlaeaceae bacterium]